MPVNVIVFLWSLYVCRCSQWTYPSQSTCSGGVGCCIFNNSLGWVFVSTLNRASERVEKTHSALGFLPVCPEKFRRVSLCGFVYCKFCIKIVCFLILDENLLQQLLAKLSSYGIFQTVCLEKKMKIWWISIRSSLQHSNIYRLSNSLFSSLFLKCRAHLICNINSHYSWTVIHWFLSQT